jgi:hypothetical protein
MANTVNDVMNVIASPDYGIKKIAGTNQEILAIIQGTHNSNNNIYNIVEDIKYLLQKIVDIKTERKSVEIGEQIYEKSNYINIKDILDETKGIRKSIDNLANVLLKQSKKDTFAPIAKLSDKASNKVADSIIKSMSKEKNGGGMSLLTDAFRKLKDINLKDIIFGKRKIKLISNIFKNANKELDIKEKDLNAIIKLVNAAPEIIKSLNKIGWRANRIIKNNIIKKISDIFIGKESILAISRVLKKNEKIFNTANEVIKNIEELSSLLKKSMRKIFFASLWAKMAKIGINSIEL